MARTPRQKKATPADAVAARAAELDAARAALADAAAAVELASAALEQAGEDDSRTAAEEALAEALLNQEALQEALQALIDNPIELPPAQKSGAETSTAGVLVVVTGPRQGRRRIGRAFSSTASEPFAVTDDELAALEADPLLKVERVTAG